MEFKSFLPFTLHPQARKNRSEKLFQFTLIELKYPMKEFFHLIDFYLNASFKTSLRENPLIMQSRDKQVEHWLGLRRENF